MLRAVTHFPTQLSKRLTHPETFPIAAMARPGLEGGFACRLLEKEACQQCAKVQPHIESESQNEDSVCDLWACRGIEVADLI